MIFGLLGVFDSSSKRSSTNDHVYGEKLANIFYNDYLKNWDRRIKTFKNGAAVYQKHLSPLGKEEKEKADAYEKAINEYEEKSNIAFIHCEKFVKEGTPVYTNIIEASYNAMDQITEKQKDLDSIIDNFDKRINSDTPMNIDQSSSEKVKKIAINFHDNYLKKGKERLEVLKNSVSIFKKNLSLFGEEEKGKVNAYEAAVNTYEEKTKIAFEYCEKFIKDGSPVSINIIQESHDALEELNKKHEDLSAAVEKFDEKSTANTTTSNESASKIIDEMANNFHDDYSQNVKGRIEIFKNAVSVCQEHLSPLGEKEKKIVDAYEAAVNTYEEKTKIAFEYCEKFIKDGSPVSINIIQESYDALDEVEKTHKDAEGLLNNMEQMLEDKKKSSSSKNDDQNERH